MHSKKLAKYFKNGDPTHNYVNINPFSPRPAIIMLFYSV